MPRVTYNRLTTKKSRTRRRGTSTITKAKYQKPTARNQKKQILSNAYAIRALKRIMPRSVLTDWQYTDVLRPSIPDGNVLESILAVQLMSPFDPANNQAFWQPVLRQDDNVIQSSATRVLRMSMNLRWRLGISEWAQMTTFIVTLRKDATDAIPNAMTKGVDYVVNGGDDFLPRLNSAIYKVHFVRNVSLMTNSWVNPAAAVGGVPLATQPGLTFAKSQVNMKLNLNIRQPSQGASWTAMDQSQFGPTQRYFLVTFFVQKASIQAPSNDGARCNFDALYTCYNSS